MRTILCPHCYHTLELTEGRPEKIICPACGLSFELEHEPESTGSARPGDGQRKLDRFDLLEKLGHGGQGTVYKAWDPTLKRVVALKVPKQEHLSGKEESERFLREAHSVSQLRHPGIVPVFEVCQDGETPVLVSEFVQGVSLDTVLLTIAQSGLKTPPELARWRNPREAAQLIAECADAVHYAHEHGVVHRDLKPGNLILDEEGRPRLMDFGMAKKEAGEVTVTIDGQVLGTPAYMAPEQARGESHRVDRRADVYSLGVILYELLTGERPFRGNREMLLYQVLNAEPPSPRSLNHLIPRDLETCCLKCLQKEPKKRYQTAKDLADDLRRFLRGEAIQARPVGSVEKAWRWGRRNPRVVAMTSAIVVLLALAIGTGTWLLLQGAETSTAAAAALAQSETSIRQEQWADAKGAAKRAEGLLAVGWGNRDLRERVQELLADLDMVAELEEIRLRQTEVKDGSFDTLRADPEYAAAFRRYGIDLGTLEPSTAAELLGRRTIKVQLTIAIKHWASVRTMPGAPTREHLIAIADTLLPPEEWHNQWAAAIAAKDKAALKTLAASPRVASLSAFGVDVVARALWEAGEQEPAMSIMEDARRRFPNDFWINHQLGHYHEFSEPPHFTEAVRFYTVAVALRPQSPGAYLNLSNALWKNKQWDEATAAATQALALKPDYAEAYVNLGIGLKGKGELDEAIACFRKAAGLKPNLYQAFANIAHALQEKGLIDESILLFRNWLNQNPDDAKAHCDLGALLCNHKRDHEGAIAALRKSATLDPSDYLTHTNLCVALNNKGLFDAAIVAGKEARRLKPDDAHVHLNLGRALKNKGALSEAVTAFEEAIRLNPTNGDAHWLLSLVLAKRGSLDAAIQSCKEAIRLEPKNTTFWNNLGAILCDQKKDYDGAISAFQAAIRLEPGDADCHLNLSKAQRHKGQFDKAVAAAKESIRLMPGMADAYYELGFALRKKGDIDGAINAYQEAIRLQPGDASVHYSLGTILCDVKRDYDGAIAEFQKAIHLEPGADYAYHSLGIALEGKGRLEEAVVAYKEAIRLKPDDAHGYAALGKALHEKGALDDALKALHEAIRIKANFGDAHYSMGLVLQEMGERESAIAAYRETIRLVPNHARAYVNLGNLLRKDGRSAKDAIECYRKAIEIQPDLPQGHYNLGRILGENALLAESLAAYKRGRMLCSTDPRWKQVFEEAVGLAERLVGLDGKLTAVLNGDMKLTDPGENIEVAQLCVIKKFYQASARFYLEALASQPQLADDLDASHRYNAACAAVLAGTGQGKDDPPPDEAAKTRLRKQALDWLRADLAAWSKQLVDKPDTRPLLEKTLRHWQTDKDLAGVRDAEALAKLPEDERVNWRQLWVEVEALRKKAGNRD